MKRIKRMMVMFPDLRGEGSLGEFGKTLKELELPAEETIFVPIVNGTGINLNSIVSSITSLLGERFQPIISSRQGVNVALETGYRKAGEKYPEAIVVRLDTQEHDPNFIGKLTRKAVKIKGMVIGNLQFNQDTLIEGTIDWFAQKWLFPEMYRQFTGGKIPLTCAHGFQVFASGILPRILKIALKIIRIAERENGALLLWGFDGAMTLAAYKLGVPVFISQIPAQIVRNRKAKKIAAQFSSHLKICWASLKMGKACPFRTECSASATREMRGEKDLIKEFCNGEGKENSWRNCVHFLLRPGKVD